MNYFAPKSVAERYAKGRPYFHPQVVSRIKAYLSLAEPVARALDVGCGTGLSTIALKTIARHVVGVDNAAEMIALAPTDPQIEYFIAPAEKIPVDDNAFDLITIYLTKYPSPPRASVGFSAEDGEQDGFRLIGQEEYQNFVRFSLETLVDYLVTQSNISAAVEGGKERIEDVRHWLTENFAPFFAGRAEATFMFRGPIWYLRKTASTGAG